MKRELKPSKAMVDDFTEWLKAEENRKFYPTGIDAIDKMLGGGLGNGLNIVMATPSQGKTTLVFNWVKHWEEMGEDVLFFTLETTKEVFAAKDLSRRMLLELIKCNKSKRHALSAKDILRDGLDNISVQQRLMIEQAIFNMKSTIGNVFLIERDEKLSGSDVVAITREYEKITGKKPIVVIDYLQILDSDSDTSDARIEVNKTLKAISKLKDNAVIAVCACKRDESHTNPITMFDAKESGQIEYDAKQIIALQPGDYEYQDGEGAKERKIRVIQNVKDDSEKAVAGDYIKIDVKVLKDKLGGKNQVQQIAYFPKFDLFLDIDDKKLSSNTILGKCSDETDFVPAGKDVPRFGSSRVIRVVK